MRPSLPAIQAVVLTAYLTHISSALPSTLPPHLVPRGPSGPATRHPEFLQDMTQRLQRRRTPRHFRDWDEEEEEEGNRYDDDDYYYYSNRNDDDDDDDNFGEEQDDDPREQRGWMDPQPLRPVEEQDPRVGDDTDFDDDDDADASPPVPQQPDEDVPVRGASATVADVNDHAPSSPAAAKPTEERVHVASAAVADTSAAPADATTPVTATFKPEMRHGVDLSKVPDIPVKPVGSGTCPGSQCAPGDCERCWETCGNCPRPGDFYGCTDKSMWSLTFDDGPSAYTGQLLDTLKQKGVHATFFVLGSQAAQFPDAIRRMHQEGHEIVSHTWSHPHLMSLTNEQIIAEIKQTEDLIVSLVGVRPRYIRPPYGEADDRVKAIFHAYGLQAVLWNMDTKDYDIVNTGKDIKDIVNAFSTVLTSGTSGLNPFSDPGFISLQHDIYLQSVQQEQDIIALLQGKGLQLVPVSQCTGDGKPYKDDNNAPVASLPVQPIGSTPVPGTPVQPVGSTPMQAAPVPGSPVVPDGATPLAANGVASPVADVPVAGASNAKQLKDSAKQPAGGFLVGSNDAGKPADSAAALASAPPLTLILVVVSAALLVHP